MLVGQISAPASHGSSGGGRYDENGRLIGITTAGIDALDAQNLNFALPVNVVSKLPLRYRAAIEAEAKAAAASAPPASESAPDRRGTEGPGIESPACAPFDVQRQAKPSQGLGMGCLS